MTTEQAIRARGVTKVFGAGGLEYHALRGIDVDVARGEFLMLAGPSGSGKTTRIVRSLSASFLNVHVPSTVTS